jgi:hypothetical protein
MLTTEAEIRAALQDGGEIYIDSSTLIPLSGALQVTKPTKIVGGMFSITSGPAFEITSSNVELDRVQVLGGMSSGGYDPSQKIIYAHGTQGAMLENIVVNQCRLFGSRANNIWLEWVKDSTVSLNIVKRFYYSGIMLISCDGITVQGNQVFDARMQDPVVNVYGIACTDLDNTELARSRNISITGNRVHLIDWEAIDTHGGDGITITGNVVTASPRGIALVVGNSTRVTAPVNCVVSGNLVNGSGARYPSKPGIFLGGIATALADATVSGNTVLNHSTPFFVNHVDRSKTTIGGNSVPVKDWSPIVMDGDFEGATGSLAPMYMIDGDMVWLRGAVKPVGSARDVIGRIGDENAWPSGTTMVAYVQGSQNGSGNGMVGVHSDGTLRFYYHTGTDTAWYHLHGSYRAV